MESIKDELKAYDTTLSAIHFQINQPLPLALIKKIVKARMKENEAVFKAKRK